MLSSCEFEVHTNNYEIDLPHNSQSLNSLITKGYWWSIAEWSVGVVEWSVWSEGCHRQVGYWSVAGGQVTAAF